MYLSDVSALRARRGGVDLRSSWIGRRRRVVHTPVRGQRLAPQSYGGLRARFTSGTLGDVGFSLRPPKWVRHAATSVKKAVTLKRVLTAGAIVAGAIVAAPVVLAAGRKLVPGALRAVGAGARGLTKVGTSIAHGLIPGGGSPSGMPPPITDRERAGFPDPTTTGGTVYDDPGIASPPTQAPPPITYGPPAPSASMPAPAPAPQVYGPPAPGDGGAAPPAMQQDAAAPGTDAPKGLPVWIIPAALIGVAVLSKHKGGR